MKHFLPFLLSTAGFLCLALGVNAQEGNEDATLIYASDFKNEVTNGVPTGWVTYNEAGYHSYGFNENGTQFTYNYGGNPGGGGNRLFEGFSGNFTKALYWGSRGTEEGYAEFGSLVKDYIMEDGSISPNMPEGIALKLAPGEYHLSFRMAAWKGEPTFTVTLFDLDYTVQDIWSEFVAAPNMDGAMGEVTGTEQHEITFSVDKSGYYILRFSVDEGTWQEYLLAGVQVYKEGGQDQEEEQVHATFDNPINTNTTWDAETREFTWSTTYYNQLRNIGLPSGDLTKYKKLLVDCIILKGEQIRIMFYQEATNKILYAKNGVNEFILEEVFADDLSILQNCTEICIAGDNTIEPGKAIINDIYLDIHSETGDPGDVTTNILSSGKYLFKNIESGMYWGVGNNWGVQASLVPTADYQTLISNDDGTYYLESQVSNGGNAIYFDGDYMDANNPKTLNINCVLDDNKNPYYTIGSEDGFYGYDRETTILGKGLQVNDPNAFWQIISIEGEDAAKYLATATADAPVDATWLIQDANFGRNNRYVSAWNVSEDCTNKNLSGGINENRCAESWHSTFTISQSFKAPKGTYRLSAQGFYRQDGSDNENLPVIFIGDQESPIPEKTGTENSLNDASVSFSAGLYQVEPILFEQPVDGDITVGVKLAENTNLWVNWDNFTLTYYGSEVEQNNDEEEQIVHATFENPQNTNTTWDAETREFTWSTTYYNQLRNIGLPNGDLSKYKKLVVDCTMIEGNQFRILFYQGSTNRTLYAKDGVNEWNLVDALKEIAPDDWNSFLKDCTEICISGDNMSAPGSVIINDIYLETYPDGEEPYIPDMEEEEDPGRPDGDFVDLDHSLFNTMYPNYNVGYKQGMGDMIYGAMDQYAYADLSAYSKLTIVATPGLHLTLTFNHQFDFESKLLLEDYTEDEEGQYIWIDAVVGEDGIYELDLTQFYPVHLNYIRIPWRYNKQGTVWYMLLTEREFVTGDANGDGVVDVTDVVSIVNCILGKPSATFNATAADVNRDGTIDVVDLVAVVNIILGKGNQAKARDMEVLSNVLTMLSEKDGMNILVEEAAKFAAMQFDITVPDDATLLDATLNSKSGHQIGLTKIGTNRYRVLAYSLNNANFEPTEDALMSLVLSDGATASIEKATFVTADGRSIAMNIVNEATGIESVDSSKLTVDNGVIYNMAGQRMGTSTQSLPAGIYIRNGKKIKVK